ncbi:hypothetical protein GCM10008957_46520 [Deinococcus ruber]|uniref:Uncharacterized protein n=1 Tax=Deinococcus ruber TaxID=1848197 RepID=A0A918FDN4_9DEIO|nr:hypothetical protein GCM10008957_46520 [Deinococcus ruber]
MFALPACRWCRFWKFLLQCAHELTGFLKVTEQLALSLLDEPGVILHGLDN